MTQTEFTSEDQYFEYKGDKLQIGDHETLVLCNLYCKGTGRHRHIDYCRNEETCKLNTNHPNIQHISAPVYPNPHQAKDFISHRLFWERTGFKARLASQSGQLQRQAANKDIISLILFDHELIVPFENYVLTDADVLLNHMIKYEASGGKDFNLAIQKAGFLINQYYDANKANIIIFLSDGGAGVPRDQLQRICEYNKTRGNPLFLYTVLFANQSESSSLRKMAEIAQEYQPPNSSVSSLRCQYNNVMTEINLVTTFVGIAE
ncbi:10502_t:CDS:2, partial [Acaulospora morrowiae]